MRLYKGLHWKEVDDSLPKAFDGILEIVPIEQQEAGADAKGQKKYLVHYKNLQCDLKRVNQDKNDVIMSHEEWWMGNR